MPRYAAFAKRGVVRHLGACGSHRNPIIAIIANLQCCMREYTTPNVSHGLILFINGGAAFDKRANRKFRGRDFRTTRGREGANSQTRVELRYGRRSPCEHVQASQSRELRSMLSQNLLWAHCKRSEAIHSTSMNAGSPHCFRHAMTHSRRLVRQHRRSRHRAMRPRRDAYI
jgi:hypothetical protein